METHVTGQPVPGKSPHYVLAARPGNHLLSESERIQANLFTHEGQSTARFTCWEISIWTKIACREAEAARQRLYYATHGRLRHLRAMPFRDHYPHSPRPWPTWVVGAPLPDHRVNTFDRLVARFQLANVLSLSLLHNRQAR